MKSSKKLNPIIHDKTSGSSEILQELHEHLKGEKRLLHAFPEIINLVKNQFKSFQNVQSYLKNLEISLIKQKNLDDFFNRYDKKLLNIYDAIFNRNEKFLMRYSNIITLSNSKTIFEILKRMRRHNKKLLVFVSESRPRFEGRLLAKKLVKENIHVKLVTEAMLDNVIRNCECSFIGADAILKDGSAVNKVGSAVLATICKFHKKPLYIIADKSKYSKNNSFDKKEMPPYEVWRHQNSNLKIKNYFFEKIDNRLITKILSD